MSETPLRFGILGAAAIAPGALVEPARLRGDVEVCAVAARDGGRARAFAAEHGIVRVLDSYEDLVADPDLDAVYVPLPAALHAGWTLAALGAGKQVLCEKPFAANAQEAARVAVASRGTGLVVMEAFHYRYHGLVDQLLALVRSGAVGDLRRVDAFFRARLTGVSDIRWDLALGGGAMMDIGCYPAHLIRTLVGQEPHVAAAHAQTRLPDVDRSMRADLVFPDGTLSHLSASMLARRPGASGARIAGSRGTIEVSGFVAPQHGHSIVVRKARGVRRRHVPRTPSSYDAQLAAFVAAVRRGAAFPTDVDDAVANMRLVDGCYRAAGLPVRPSRPG